MAARENTDGTPPPIPVVVFAYARPDHLERTLQALRGQEIPLLWLFCDGARRESQAERVRQVRELASGIDWVETRLVFRDTNLGLARSILSGVSEVLASHEGCIVLEDDLVTVPGTYAYLSAVMRTYRGDPKVMSVSGWTHPMLVPGDGSHPYFDGRADSLCFGVWKENWLWETDIPAHVLYAEALRAGIDPERYGFDIKRMTHECGFRDIWAVKFVLHHMRHRGLCARPPFSLVEHIGYDELATNTPTAHRAAARSATHAPELPSEWPKAVEADGTDRRWRHYADGNVLKRWVNRALRESLVRLRRDTSFYYLPKRDLLKKALRP